jgi:colicin import membrane protein
MSSESVRDRWLSIGMSVLLHGSLVALLAVGWWHFRHPAPAPTPPIDATVVDARTLKGTGVASTPTPKSKPAPQAEPPPPTPQMEGPPPPTPDEVAMREQAAKQEAEHEAKAQKALLARQQAKEAQQKAQAEASAAEQAQEAQKAQEAKEAAQAKKLADEKEEAQAQKVAAAKKKVAAKLAAQKKLAEERKLAEAKKLAEQRAAEAARQAEDERQARVADLQRSLQEDERASAASGAMASWTSELESRIQQHWIRPPTAQQGIDCVLNVSLVSGGDVTAVSLGQCNGDDAVRESIKNAVYAASPLPPPPNNIAYPHQLEIEFKPTN